MAESSSFAGQPAVDVETDVASRIVRLHFRGRVTAQALHARVDAIRDAVKPLGAGFSLITDLSNLQEMEIDSVRDLTRLMDFCLEAGVRQIVRVIPDPDKDIGFHLLSVTHYRGRVPIATCETVSEAEKLLARR